MMRINFQDGNSIEIVGNNHFVSNVMNLIMPVLHAYESVGQLNSEPHDPQRMEVEIQMAREAEGKGGPFTGKYVSYLPAST